jgi:hypothetical protein
VRPDHSNIDGFVVFLLNKDEFVAPFHPEFDGFVALFHSNVDGFVALFHSNVDGFVARSQRVNSRMVGQNETIALSANDICSGMLKIAFSEARNPPDSFQGT